MTNAPSLPSGRLLTRGLALFLPLSAVGLVAVFVWSADTASLSELVSRASPGALTACLLVVPIVDWLVSGFRTWVLTRSVAPRVSFAGCVRNAIVGAFMAATTPSQTGALPAQALVLTHEGATPGQALAVLFMVLVATLASFAAACAAGLAVSLLWLAGAYAPILGGGALLFAAPSVAGLALMRWPQRGRAWLQRRARSAIAASRWSRRVGSWAGQLADTAAALERIGRGPLWRMGAATLAAMVVCANKCVAALLAADALGVPVSAGEVLLGLVVLQIGVNVLPTPGGSGGAEIGLAAVFAGVVPSALLPGFTLLWRTSTLYLSVAAGGALLLVYSRRIAAARSGQADSAA